MEFLHFILLFWNQIFTWGLKQHRNKMVQYNRDQERPFGCTLETLLMPVPKLTGTTKPDLWGP